MWVTTWIWTHKSLWLFVCSDHLKPTSDHLNPNAQVLVTFCLQWPLEAHDGWHRAVPTLFSSRRVQVHDHQVRVHKWLCVCVCVCVCVFSLANEFKYMITRCVCTSVCVCVCVCVSVCVCVFSLADELKYMITRCVCTSGVCVCMCVCVCAAWGKDAAKVSTTGAWLWTLPFSECPPFYNFKVPSLLIIASCAWCSAV